MAEPTHFVFKYVIPALLGVIIALIAYVWKYRETKHKDDMLELKKQEEIRDRTTKNEFQSKLEVVKSNVNLMDRRHSEARQKNLETIQQLLEDSQKTMASIRKSLKEDSAFLHKRMDAMERRHQDFEIEQARYYMNKSETREFFKELLEPLAVQMGHLTQMVEEIKSENKRGNQK